MKSFSEIGIGNPTFVNTQIEEPGNVKRIPGIVRLYFRSMYLRIWIGTKVFIIDTKDGLKKMSKPRKKFKVVLGIFSEV